MRDVGSMKPWALISTLTNRLHAIGVDDGVIMCSQADYLDVFMYVY